MVKNLPVNAGDTGDLGNAGDLGDVGSIPGLGRSPGEGKGYPFQYSVLVGLQRPETKESPKMG